MSITRGGTLPCAPLPQSSDSCTVGGTHWTKEWSCWAFSGSYAFAHCCCYCSDTRSCPTLATLWAVAPPGSSVHGIFQARILEWVAISFSGDLPNPGIESVSSALAGGFFVAEKPGKPAFAHPLPNYLRYSISLSLTGWPLPISQALQTLPHLLQAAVLMSSNDLRALGTCSLFLWCCR